jgi:TetR/AcrR family transcriptional regulator
MQEKKQNKRIEQNKLNRKEEILDAAEKVFFEKGFRDATMDDIASKALYSKAALYQYYKTKDEIYICICNRGITIMLEMFENAIAHQKIGLSKIANIGDAHFEYMIKYSDYYKCFDYISNLDMNAISQSECFASLIEKNNKINNIMVEVIQEGQNDGSIRKDVSAQNLSHILRAMNNGIFKEITMMNSDPTLNQDYFFLYHEYRKVLGCGIDNLETNQI